MTDTAPRRSRAETVLLEHELPPYQPTVGDIILVYHAFGDLEDGPPPDKDGKPQAWGKFRPCIVMAARGNDLILTPFSSEPEKDKHHLEVTEPSELEQIGLYDDKVAYAKVLETAKYDNPNPLINPFKDEGKKPSWVVGRAPDELRKQLLGEMWRQKLHGRFKDAKDRRAEVIPEKLLGEMYETAENAQIRAARREAEEIRQNTPRRKLPPGVVRPAEGTFPSEDQPPSESAAPREKQIDTSGNDRDAEVRARAEDMARRRRCHPDQIAEAREGAKAMAKSRGVDLGAKPPSRPPRKKNDQQE